MKYRIDEESGKLNVQIKEMGSADAEFQAVI
jgi:hypothetical protein